MRSPCGRHEKNTWEYSKKVKEVERTLQQCKLKEGEYGKSMAELRQEHAVELRENQRSTKALKE